MDLLEAAQNEEQIEKFVQELVDVKDIQSLRDDLSEILLNRYVEMSKSREGAETLAEIMEAEEFSPGYIHGYVTPSKIVKVIIHCTVDKSVDVDKFIEETDYNFLDPDTKENYEGLSDTTIVHYEVIQEDQ